MPFAFKARRTYVPGLNDAGILILSGPFGAVEEEEEAHLKLLEERIRDFEEHPERAISAEHPAPSIVRAIVD